MHQLNEKLKEKIRKVSFFESKIVDSEANDTIVLSMNAVNFVRVNYRGKELKFLLDTGATVSVIFQNSIAQDEVIDQTRKIKIHGIAGSTVSQGSVQLLLSFNNVEMQQEFLLMREFECGMNGVIGADFFIKHDAIINYEKNEFSFWSNDRKIFIPIESQCEFYTEIPSRCEIIKYCYVENNDDYVVLPDEICEGVYIAGSIVCARDNLIPVKILNVRDGNVKLKNFRPKLEKATNYHICEAKETMQSVSRVDKLLKLLKTDDLNNEEKISIQKICAKYSDVFLLEGDELTVTNIYKQSIRLQSNATPVYTKPYRLPHAQKDEIHQQVGKMLKDGIIEEARSEWSAPLLIVPKKSADNCIKKWRIVIDYRKLNKQIQDEKFPLPCITEILDSLSGAMYFSHLDLSQGYYQIELDEASRPCTAFLTNQGQYQMKRLPMGLKISPSAFSRAMTIAMAGLNYTSCLVYMDDIVIFGNNLLNHNKNLVKVLGRLRQVKLRINPNKCEFLKKEILYLGHVISATGISPDPEKIRVIQNYPVPKDAKETKRFVAFANYYRRYIKNFAYIAVPLNRLAKKGVKFEWNDDCQKAFETLKNSLMTPPILEYPNFSKENIFNLKTDASGSAIGAVLTNASDKPVAYASRTLNKGEKNYCTIEKELLAIVWGVKYFRPYLYGRKFIIQTDHRPLVYLFGMTNPSSRLTKFRLILEEYDFDVVYIKGKDNVTADALSRIEISSSEIKSMSHRVFCTMNVLTRAQSKAESKTCENSESVSSERTDHPGVVELIKQPENFFELRPIYKTEFDKILASKTKMSNTCSIYKSHNLIVDNESDVIYMKWDIRSASALSETLRVLKDIVMKYKIPELVVIKNKRDASSSFLREIMTRVNEVRFRDLKISVIKDVQRIDDLEARQIILNDFHILPTGGHAGINRMYNNVRKYFFWTKLRKDVEEFVKKCDSCQRYKHGKHNLEPMAITTTAYSAFQKIFLDIVGPLEQDVQNNRYILTIQCELSKFVEAYPIPNKEAVTVAESFVQNFILRYGIPQEIVTDQGTEFLSSTFKEACKVLGIKQLNSTAYHHETLGALENSHKHLGAYLRIQVAKHPNSWSSWVSFWCFSYNNSVHSETRYTPFELVFGQTCRLPSNVLTRTDPLYSFDDYPLELKYRLQTACNDARNKLLLSKEKRKKLYDSQISKIVRYPTGSKIMLRNNVGNKSEPVYKGPYTVVVDKAPNVVINIGNKLIEVHKNRVKKYHE